MATNLRWDAINANFGDANSAMRNAITGVSQAGTIFGDLRKSILDEEQRAIDNAYKERALAEGTRQFDVRMDEAARHNRASEDVANERMSMLRGEYSRVQGNRDALSQAVKEVTGRNDTQAAKLKSIQGELASNVLAPEYRKSLESEAAMLEQERRVTGTATGMDNAIRQRYAELTGEQLSTTPMSNLAEAEGKLTANKQNIALKQQENYQASQVKATEMLDKADMSESTKKALGRALTTAQAAYPNTPPATIMAVLMGEGYNRGMWNKLPFTEVVSGIDDFMANPKDPTNPIAQKLANANRVALATGGNGVEDIPSQREIALLGSGDLSGQTEAGLQYIASQAAKSLPDPSTVTLDSGAGAQALREIQLTTFGGKPLETMSADERKVLETLALDKARRDARAAIDMATRNVTNERERRIAQEMLEAVLEATHQTW